MTTEPIGIYVHTPFCIKKCNYCDFCSFPISDFEKREEYIKALILEIASYGGREITVDSVFFGGGTPSLLRPEEIKKIVCELKHSFQILPDAEFTLEANPKTVSEENLLLYRELGVNRISIGLQSIHENEQKMLGRTHNFDDFLTSYELVRASGISNVNVDLMYGIPEQTLDSFEKTLRRVLALSPEHISLYGLILEEDTPLFSLHRQNRLTLPTEDEECDMYSLAARILAEAGYSHYEISNYARVGYECRHNLKYWNNMEYIGVGVSAYSNFGNRRYGNSRDISEYISDYSLKYDVTESDAETERYDYVMLGLRLKDGISLSEYKKRFSSDFIMENEEQINSFLSGGFMQISGDRLSLTERGFYVSNTILTALL